MFNTLLIANRGEIACRIMRTARRLGISTIAVYSDADQNAKHVREADHAIRLGPAAARDSYLRGDLILKAAQELGADAIHPGYGFLSENADFAQACTSAGIAFVGPRPDAIRDMGLKDRAKAIAQQVGAPVLPGYWEAEQSTERLKTEADRIGFPLLIKAVAGGGGRGIRVVESLDGLALALQSAKREAAAAFGDDRVMLERLVLCPRHIEVQIFGDLHGNLVHLFERDCSIQRRRQKLIEEAPAPGMTEAVRDSLTQAALKIARAVHYCNAGTVEFVFDGQGPLRPDGFWFLEMNTRLQVEHPVTEAIVGLDLVEWQLRVAAGEKLPLNQADIIMTGAAIEARLVAEDPSKGFLPSSGVLGGLSHQSKIRIDSGFDLGDRFPDTYDSLIEKAIAHGQDRPQAIRLLQQELSTRVVTGIKTNIGYLERLCRLPAFLQGEVHTGLLEEAASVLSKPDGYDARRLALGAIGVQVARELEIGDFPSPFNLADGWRLNANAHLAVHFEGEPDTYSLSIKSDATQISASIAGDHGVVARNLLQVVGQSGAWTMLIAHDKNHRAMVDGDATIGSIAATLFVDKVGVTLVENGEVWHYRLTSTHDNSDGLDASDDIQAPLPGKIVMVYGKPNQQVKQGQVLAVLEAMKMEHALTATRDGFIQEIYVQDGRQVKAGDTLIRLKPE
ncbi:acetyl/propionyl/methylcrotonyl-CoA carboxylase subunit alpha [Candidatus Phycosocius spiralis]|uniref:3-methylcrotonyl-CoA carboxylase subunit alpha n=1 Tax=Candidatus Phycosocius spiralis TaxID=2815099 RepID=A0ABQ4PSG6_9PROT|nr:biotin carboxylase N-terminal domain-containing protein [Candidatus Phycosocius spiralis]GIU65918.1 3-methylcrotonyl-CoA carboxylase subunit alpha [Candidatus Phycosocius spiralis]